MHGCAQLLKLFDSHGIDALVLKGAALISAYYSDPGVRPMEDFDILVPHAQAQRAIAALRAEAQHASTRLAPGRFTADFMAVRHSCNLATRYGNFDLHWHALNMSMDAALDAELWQAAEPLQIHGVATHTLCATDMLFHLCVHGAAWAPVPPVRWIADSIMILRSPGIQIDWARLVHLATRFRLSLALHFALDYLRQHILPHAASVQSMPDFVLETLATAPVTRLEQQLFRVYTQRSSRFGMLPVLWVQHAEYKARRRLAVAKPATAESTGNVPADLNFLRYIGVYYGYQSLGEVVRWALDRTMQRSRRMLFGPPAS